MIAYFYFAINSFKKILLNIAFFVRFAHRRIIHALNDFFILAEKEGFFANSVACRAVPPHSRFLRFANLWRQKQSPGLFFLALQIPSEQIKRTIKCPMRRSNIFHCFIMLKGNLRRVGEITMFIKIMIENRNKPKCYPAKENIKHPSKMKIPVMVFTIGT